MSIGKKVVDKVSKVFNIPNFLKETVTRVLKIQPDKIIICGYNTKTNTIASGGAGEIGTSDAVLMLTSALASVYLELPKDGDKRFPINDFMSSMNVMTLDAIQKRDPQAIYSSTVPVNDHRLPDPPFPPTTPVPPVEVQESVVEEPVNKPATPKVKTQAQPVKRVRKTPVKKDNK